MAEPASEFDPLLRDHLDKTTYNEYRRSLRRLARMRQETAVLKTQCRDIGQTFAETNSAVDGLEKEFDKLKMDAQDILQVHWTLWWHVQYV